MAEFAQHMDRAEFLKHILNFSRTLAYRVCKDSSARICESALESLVARINTVDFSRHEPEEIGRAAGFHHKLFLEYKTHFVPDF